jgi:hypothetical protein
VSTAAVTGSQDSFTIVCDNENPSDAMAFNIQLLAVKVGSVGP